MSFVEAKSGAPGMLSGSLRVCARYDISLLLSHCGSLKLVDRQPDHQVELARIGEVLTAHD
jgi:hypothetical protein